MSHELNKKYSNLDQKHYLQTFKRYPLTLERACGSHAWDVDGNEYVDALAGIAVNSVGHCHPKIVKAIQEQAAKLIHISNFYLSVPQVELSKRLTVLSGLERVFFGNSGAEAVEGAFKIARKYAHSRGRGGTIISFDGSFHGRTLATIATGAEKMQKGFDPIPAGFIKIPFNDMNAVRDSADRETAAIIIEPVQGEGGINIADGSFLKELRMFCDDHDIVLIFDEIQCGMGRTGKMFAFQHHDVRPDIMTLAKALGGGTPISAILSSEKVSSEIEFGDHGTTFGGNPLVCAAALATIDVIEEENLLQQAEEKHGWFKKQIDGLNEASIKEFRGLGLMIGIEFEFDTRPLVQEMLNRGVLANATAGNVLRLVPPLNIEEDDMNKIMSALKEALKAVKSDE